MITQTGTLTTTPLNQTIPPALERDDRTIALVAALAEQLREHAELIPETAGIYYRIPELPEKILDILATDLHVDWYDYADTLEEKREVIASSVYVHRHLGTTAAIRRVLADNFGGGDVREWFDYGGEAHHFKVSTTSVQRVYKNLERFLDLLQKAKKASAVLDNVDIIQNEKTTAGIGLASKTGYEYTNTMEASNVHEIFTWLVDENENLLINESGDVLLDGEE